MRKLSIPRVPHEGVFLRGATLPPEYRQFYVKAHDLPPRGRRSAGCAGKGLLTLGPGSAYLTTYHKRTFTALMLSWAIVGIFMWLTRSFALSPDPVYRVLAFFTGFAVIPGFFLWFYLLDELLTSKGRFILSPSTRSLKVDANQQLFSLELSTSLWVTVRLVKEWNAGYGELVEELARLYSSRMTNERLPRFSIGGRLAAMIVGVLFIVAVLLILSYF